MDKKKFEEFLIKNTFINLIKMPELGVLLEIVRTIKKEEQQTLFLHLTKLKSSNKGEPQIILVPKYVKNSARTTLYSFEELSKELESYVLNELDKQHIIFVHPQLNIVFFKSHDSNKIVITNADKFMNNASFWSYIDRKRSGLIREELNQKILTAYIVQSKIYDNAFINENLIDLYNDLLEVFESVSNSKSPEVMERVQKNTDLLNKIYTNINSNDIENQRYALNMYYSQFAKSKKDVSFSLINYSSKFGKTLDINPEDPSQVEALPEHEKIKLFQVFIDILFEGVKEKEKIDSNEDEKEKIEIELAESIESTKQVLLEVQKLHGIIEKTSTEIYNPLTKNLDEKDKKIKTFVN